MSDRIRVTCTNPETGESETQELDPHSYILICGEFMELSSCQHWPVSGTFQMTLKRRSQEEE